MLNTTELSESEIIQTLRLQILRQQEEFKIEKIKYTEELSKKDEQIDLLSKQLLLLKKFKYGRSSEKIRDGQLGFFNEAEMELENSEKTNDKRESNRKSGRRGTPKRRPIPENLPRRQVIIELPAEDRQCPVDGTELKEMGREVSEKLNIIPATVEVVQTVRIKYGCSECKEQVVVAPLPAHILPKSLTDVGLLALIVVSKFVDAMPLYRIEGILARIGVSIPRSTMGSWVVELGKKFVILTNILRDHLLSGDYIRVDETHVQVLDKNKFVVPKKGKLPSQRAYMWVYASAGPPMAGPIVLYDYQPSRSQSAPNEMLAEFEGYLQVDGYGGYDVICKNKKVIRVGCWAHARRKFSEAWETLKKPKTGLAAEALVLIARLYKIEEDIRDTAIENRFAVRLTKAKPILDEIELWLNGAAVKCLPKSSTGKAIGYLRNQWPHLVTYLLDGRLEIDNNYVENKIRPFAVGRKNWLCVPRRRCAMAA